MTEFKTNTPQYVFDNQYLKDYIYDFVLERPKYEFYWDTNNGYESAYYYIDDEKKIVYDENDEPFAIYNEEKEHYPHSFHSEAVIKDFDYINNDIPEITKDNVNEFEFTIVEICDCCLKSWNEDQSNEYGICNHWCDCNTLLRDCRYSCYN